MIKNLLIQILFLLLPALLRAQENPLAFTRQVAEGEARAAARYLEALDAKGGSTLASSNFDVHHYRLDLQVDPAVRYIAGAVTVSFTMTTAGDRIILDLVDTLAVDSVTHHGGKLAFQRPGDQSLVINLPASLPAGASDSFTVHYQGPPPEGSGFGSFAVTTQGGTPVMWTLSEPYGSREWWPCKNGLDDKADSVDVLITTPIAYTATSNGLLLAEDSSATWRRSWWAHRYPIASYLVAIAATNYSVTRDTVDLEGKVMPLMQHCYPGYENYYRDAFPRTKNGLRVFTRYFGEYPFIRERYGHTQFSWGGGMEHQTNSFMNNLSGGMVYHEMAHQWFGDKITCGSWQHIWLNEGFATFGTYLMYENAYSPEFNITLRKGMVDFITSKRGGTVFVEDTSFVSRIFDSRLSYNKGCMLLRMLRGIMGDSAFFRAIRAYQQDPALAYRYAVTTDLQRHLEREGGIKLDEFFRDWFYGGGYPSYQLHWRPIGGRWAFVELSQSTSDPGVGFFEMPVPVKFISSTQSKTVVIDHRSNKQQQYIDLGFVPDSVVIDPEIWLVSANNAVFRMVADDEGSPEIRAFPNPVETQLQVWLKRIPDGRTALTLHDALGRLVWSREADIVNGGDYMVVPMDRLARGAYWMSVRQGREVIAVKKILK